MKTIEVFTLSELKEKNPAAYDKVLNQWSQACGNFYDSSEVMDSLKAVIEACGGTLNNWSIGTYSQGNFLSVSVNDEYEESFVDDAGDDDYRMVQKDSQWLFDNVLKDLGYKMSNVGSMHIDFPGLCPLTGVCYDDDFLEAVCKALDNGDTLTDALQGLEHEAGKMMEDEIEQMQGEESMLANWDNRHYTIDGIEV